MKLKNSILLLVSLVVLCGCATDKNLIEDGTKEKIINSDNANTEHATDSTETSVDKNMDEQLYKTTVSYDAETGIERTTLDTQGHDASIFFEIPIFEETSGSYKAINAYMRGVRDDFFTSETLIRALEHIYDPDKAEQEGRYVYNRRAVVNCDTDKYISISILYEWWMGGAGDYGSDSYTFSKETGELLSLTDIIDMPEDEIKKLIMELLKEKSENSEEKGWIDLDYINGYALEDFEFVIRDREVWINFDKYEAADGAHGGFDIKLIDLENF